MKTRFIIYLVIFLILAWCLLNPSLNPLQNYEYFFNSIDQTDAGVLYTTAKHIQSDGTTTPTYELVKCNSQVGIHTGENTANPAAWQNTNCNKGVACGTGTFVQNGTLLLRDNLIHQLFFSDSHDDTVGNMNATPHDWENGVFDDPDFGIMFDNEQNGHLTLDNVLLGGRMTIAIWARWDKFTDWSRLIDFGNGQGQDNILLGQFSNGATKNIILNIRRGENDRDGKRVQAGTITLGRWTHIAFTVQGKDMRLFQNGVQVGINTDGHEPRSIRRTNHYVARSNWPGDKTFHGAIGSLQIWNRSLRQDEILALWRLGKGVYPTNIIEGGIDAFMRKQWSLANRYNQDVIRNPRGGRQYGADTYFLNEYYNFINDPQLNNWNSGPNTVDKCAKACQTSGYCKSFRFGKQTFTNPHRGKCELFKNTTYCDNNNLWDYYQKKNASQYGHDNNRTRSIYPSDIVLPKYQQMKCDAGTKSFDSITNTMNNESGIPVWQSNINDQGERSGNVPRNGLIHELIFTQSLTDKIGDMHATFAVNGMKMKNHGIKFRGGSDHLTLNAVQLGGEMTIAFWAQWDEISQWTRVVSFTDIQTTPRKPLDTIRMGSNAMGQLDFTTLSGDVGSGTGGGKIVSGKWTHVVGTVNDDRLVLYQDGDLVSERVDNNANILVYKPNIKIRAHNTLGKSAHAGTSFKGTLGSLHIWNRVLTADEVKTLYDDGKITPSFMTLEECASSCETNHNCNSFAYGNLDQVNGSDTTLATFRLAHQPGNSNHMNIAEFKVEINGVDITNTLTNKRMPSGTWNNYPISNAFDNDTTTFLHSSRRTESNEFLADFEFTHTSPTTISIIITNRSSSGNRVTGNYVTVEDRQGNLLAPRQTVTMSSGGDIERFDFIYNGNVGACVHYRNEYHCNNNPKWSYYQVKGASPYTENTEDNINETRITELESDVGALETTVGNSTSGLVSKVDGLISDVGDTTSGLISDVGGLISDVGDVNSGLISDVGDISGQINILSGGVSGLQSQVGDVNSGLISAVGDISGQINTLSGGVSGLQSQVGDVNSGLISDVGDISGQINILSGGVSGLKSQVGDANSGLVSDVGDISGQINILSGDVDVSMLNTVSTFAEGQNIYALQNITTILGDISGDITDISINTYNNTATIGDISINTYNNTATIGDINRNITDISNTILNDVIHRWMNKSDISGDPIQTALTHDIDVSNIAYTIYNNMAPHVTSQRGRIGKYF